jgi:shikimate 5-dehydrogenase
LKKWTSISPTNEEHRWNYLSAKLKNLGVANEYVQWTGRTNGFDDVKELEAFNHVRLSTSVGPGVLKSLKVQSSWATLIGVIDGMVRSGDTWWPLCALYESFGQLLIHVGQELDVRGSVMVAGAGGISRVAIAAFFKAGFKSVLLTNFQEAEAEDLIREIRAKFFGLEIRWVPMDKIVLLPGESSALVNCTPSIEENPLLIELSYLNFLKRPGFLFDSSRYPKSSMLVQEALDSGVRVIDGVEIAARADVLWAKWAFGVDLPLDDYRAGFHETLKGTGS